MITKICFKCGGEKGLDNFYAHSRMADGHLNKCKDCTKADTTARAYKLKNDPEWVEKERVRCRDKYRRYKYKSKHKHNPDKRKIRGLTSHIRGKGGIEYHHWSYKEEYAKDTIQLTVSSHRYLHARLEYNEAAKCYQTKAGRLLDTKDAHLAFMKEINVKEVNGNI